jgi:methionyl-tRNA formyltransferase
VGAERKRIVILTRDGLEHRYVVNTLCARLDIDRVVIDRRRHIPNTRRAMRKGLGHFLSKAARTSFLRLLGDDKARARSLRHLLGERAESFRSDKIDYVDGVNSNETIALLRQRDPTALLVYGTSVVKNNVLMRVTERYIWQAL